MGMEEDFAAYTDPDGLLQPMRNPPRGASGNGVRYTSEGLLLQWKLNHDVKSEQSPVFQNFNRAMAACRTQPGLYRRSPSDYGQDSDDYTALIAASVVSRSRHHWAIAYRAHANPGRFGPLECSYNFNNREPDKVSDDLKTWFGRSPCFRFQVQVSTLDEPTWLEQAGFAYSLLDCILRRDQNNQDEWCLTNNVVWTYETLRFQSPDLDRLVEGYRQKFKATWPEGIGQVYAKYFQNKDHPLAKYGLGVFP